MPEIPEATKPLVNTQFPQNLNQLCYTDLCRPFPNSTFVIFTILLKVKSQIYQEGNNTLEEKKGEICIAFLEETPNPRVQVPFTACGIGTEGSGSMYLNFCSVSLSEICSKVTTSSVATNLSTELCWKQGKYWQHWTGFLRYLCVRWLCCLEWARLPPACCVKHCCSYIAASELTRPLSCTALPHYHRII